MELFISLLNTPYTHMILPRFLPENALQAEKATLRIVRVGHGAIQGITVKEQDLI